MKKKTEEMKTGKARALIGESDDGVLKVGITRIGYAYIYEKPGSYPPSDTNLVFQYDAAGNQIRRETKLVN